MVTSQVMVIGAFINVLMASCALTIPATNPPVDVGVESKRLVSLIRNVTVQAKEGTSLDLLKMNVLNLQRIASDLLAYIPEKISECQTQAVIKMAATRIGSHEVLGLLLAEGPVAILSRRLELSLAILKEIAQQLEDELMLSRDIGPHLAALVFGSNTSSNIIGDSGQVVMDAYTRLKDNKVTVNKDVALGTGFSFGQTGAHWKSTMGNHYFQITPTHLRLARQTSLEIGTNSDGYKANISSTFRRSGFSGRLDGRANFDRGLGFQRGGVDGSLNIDRNIERGILRGSRVTGKLDGQANFGRGVGFQDGRVGGTIGIERDLGKLGRISGEVSGGVNFNPGRRPSGYIGPRIRWTF